MRSIQFKFLTVVLATVVILSTFITVTSAIFIKRTLNSDADMITETVAETEALRIDNYLRDITYTVMTMKNYLELTLHDRMALVGDEEKRIDYEEEMFNAIYAPMKNFGGILGFYVRFDPELVGDEYAGFYAGKKDVQADEFFLHDPATLLGWAGGEEWYERPKARGVALWLEPYQGYYNNNTGVEIISYVTPLYVDSVFIGVAGVDVAFSHIENMISGISVYDNGFAYLAMADKRGEIQQVIYAPDAHLLESAAKAHEYAEEHVSLANGMTLVIHADYSDIQEENYRLIAFIIIFIMISLGIAAIVTYWLTKRIVSPLKRITVAAEGLADGKTDLRLDDCKTRDEIGVLATAFEKTAKKLHGYMGYINTLAYRDSLTGVKNRAAYTEEIAKIDVQLRTGQQEAFAIVVADINRLKKTNDRYGHEIGNRLIVRASKVICDTFKHSPVFRIGGDEFVIILTREDFENREALIAQLDATCEKTYVSAGEEQISVSIARGIECFNMDVDVTIEEVVNRADKNMYKHKEAMKKQAALVGGE